MDAAPAPRHDWLEPVATRKVPVAVAAVAVVALLAWRLGPRPDLVAFGYLGVVGVLLTVIDAQTKRLPDPLTLPSYLVGAALLAAAAPFVEDGGERFVHALAGMAGLWLCYAVQWFIVPAQIGLGDVKLAGVLGLYLGWLGLTAVLTAVVAIHLLAGAVAFGLLVTRRAGLKTLIPFGPFMLLGAFFAVLLHAS